MWHRSAHAKQVDVALNETCRIITGCLKPTPLDLLYPLAGIAPPEVRREVACMVEKNKQETDPRHLLFNAIANKSRLKSRNSFLRSSSPTSEDPSAARLKLWKEKHSPPPDYTVPAEQLPRGHKESWSTWKSLNRLRTQVGRCNHNLYKWGYQNKSACECGVEQQTMPHLLTCSQCPFTCSLADLYRGTNEALEVAKFWANHV